MAHREQLQESPLLDSKDLLHKKRMAVVLHTCLLTTIFLPCTIFLASMANNVDVLYFCGYWILLTLLVPVALVIFAIVALRMNVPRSAFLLVVVCPCLFLGVFFFLYGDHVELIEKSLMQDDCTSSKAKQDLQLAYNKGLNILKKCYTENGAALPRHIEDCDEWESVTKDIIPEMSYLAHLEHEVGCSGICDGSRLLFSATGQRSAPCISFIVEDIRMARLQSTVLMWYSLVVLVIAIPCYYFVAPLLDQYYVSIPSPRAMQALPVQQSTWAAPVVQQSH